MKKKEKEYIKLQERLNQVLMEKKKESRSGMEIMNLLQVRILPTVIILEEVCQFSFSLLIILIMFLNVQAEGRTATWDVEWEEN